MIIKDRKLHEEAYEESSWRRFETKVRGWLYTLMHELTRNQNFSVPLYLLLLFIEACQFVWYAWHPRLYFLWDSKVFEGLQTAFKYSQIDGFLEDGGQTATLSILYIAFVFLVAMLAIGILGTAFISKFHYKADSSALNYSLKALNLYNFLLSTVLAFPFYFICMTIFACSKNNPLTSELGCYEGIFYLHLVVAIISLIILLATSLILTFLSVDLNPWSKSPFAAPKSRVNLVKVLLKIVVCLYFALDYKGEYIKEYTAIYCVLWIIILIMRYRQTPFYNRSIFNFIIGLETCVVWITLGSVFQAFIDTPPSDNIGLLFLILLMIPWMLSVIVLFKMRRERLLKASPKSLKSPIDAELYLLNAVELIENRSNLEKRMTLEGLLKLHIKQCTKPSEECPCRFIAQNYFKEEEAPEKMWYTWLKSVIDDCVDKFPKSARLHVFYSCLAREKLENKYKALFELMAAQNSRPSIEEQFTLYRYRNMIQQDMIDVDIRINKNKINVNLIVEFQSKFLKFQSAIEAAVELHLEFWRELMEASPEVQKLQSLGSRITQAVEETMAQYKKLASLNANQIRMLQIYGNFLKDIVNDDIEGARVIERATHVTKSDKLDKEMMDKIQLKYGENSDTCLITCSGNSFNLGTILRVNKEITRILKYTREDVEGANVNYIMPRVIADMHDEFMKNYLATSVAKTIDRETIAFPVNKNGYLVPCTLMVKVLPNLHAGIRFVGFMQEIDEGNELNDEIVSARNSQDNLKKKASESEKNDKEKYYIMYDGRTGGVYGITAGCKRDFGIAAKLAQGDNMGQDNFTIDNIFPDLLHCNIDSLKMPHGVDLRIDTSMLKQNFLFTHDDSIDNEDMDVGVKYQSKKMNVMLVQDDEYPSVHLRVIRFMEPRDQDDDDNDDFEQEANLPNDMSAFKKSEYKVASEDSPTETKKRTNTLGLQEEASRSQAEGIGSDLSSSQPEINEEMRLIKDFRALISKSATPRSIIVIRNIALLMTAALIGLMSFGLSVKFNQIGEYREGVVTITDTHQRHSDMADLNFNVRRLQLVASGFIDMTNDEIVALRAKILAIVDSLRSNTLKIGDHQENLVSNGLPSIESDNVSVESLLQNGTKTENRSFSNSISQYISHATSVANADLSTFVSDDVRVSTKASFYFVRRNGLGCLRDKSEYNAQVYYNYYWDDIDSFDNQLKIILIVAIIVLVIALSIIMFIVFSVHKTATSILSLFMFIPPSEIKELALKCQAFMEAFLEDRKKTNDFSFAEEDQYRKKATNKNEEQGYLEINLNEDDSPVKNPEESDNRMLGKGLSTEDRHSITPSMQQIQSTSTNQEIKLLGTDTRPLGLRAQNLGSYTTGRMETEDGLLRTEGNETTERPLRAGRGGEIKPLDEIKEKLKEEKKSGHEEPNEVDANRAAAFMNSRDEYKGKIIFHFILITMVFLAYLLADYFDNRTTLDRIQVSMVHLKLRNERMPSIRFMTDFTLEELAEGNEYPVYNYTDQPYVNLRNKYRAAVLNILQAMAKNRKQSFPSELDAYFKLNDIAVNDDLCANYYSTDQATKDGCYAAANGLLAEGATIAITRMEQISGDIIKEFNKTKTTSLNITQTQIDFINGEKFTQDVELMNYTVPVSMSLLAEFSTGFQNYMNERNTIDRIKFVVFIILMLFMALCVWIPYKMVLKDKIFKAKGMLKMIPIEMITKDDNLKQTFFSGNILQAVK